MSPASSFVVLITNEALENPSGSSKYCTKVMLCGPGGVKPLHIASTDPHVGQLLT